MSVSGTNWDRASLVLEGKASNAVLASKASSLGQHPDAGHEQTRCPVTSTGRREVVAGLSSQARKLCLLFFSSRLHSGHRNNGLI